MNSGRLQADPFRHVRHYVWRKLFSSPIARIFVSNQFPLQFTCKWIGFLLNINYILKHFSQEQQEVNRRELSDNSFFFVIHETFSMRINIF